MSGKQTVSKLIEKRHNRGMEVTVYVEGDLNKSPPVGNAAAMRIAHLLDDTEDGIARVDPENTKENHPENPGVVVTTLPENPPQDQWESVMRRLLSRTPSKTDVVVLVDQTDVPAFCERLCELRLVATGIDDTINAYRVRENPYEGETYFEELEFAPQTIHE